MHKVQKGKRGWLVSVAYGIGVLGNPVETCTAYTFQVHHRYYSIDHGIHSIGYSYTIDLQFLIHQYGGDSSNKKRYGLKEVKSSELINNRLREQLKV